MVAQLVQSRVLCVYFQCIVRAGDLRFILIPMELEK